ncbi:FimV family protein [Acinetobacter nectaris]|uniref:type IV pilus assembly protein FimV n=1 Tax=Acinetobacter nectaris TaxID=1219382 RepID=UPI001F3F68E6|nr:FimV/HubP family polar landmark protein [Acinetobacter nectaris]MCF9000269.1 hypothetical protein [Acinetobacter nectaris]MCF9027236.1 hypothetical protein [Acinetobacter nectaris]
MTTYHKLTYAILCLGMSQLGHALTFDQPQILSTKAQLLYMEIPFHDATTQHIQVEVANDDDLKSFDALQAEITDDLNIFIRSTGSNNGIITVTSSQPIQNDHVRFILKTKDGNGQYLKLIDLPFKVSSTPTTQPLHSNSNQIQDQPLIPITISSESQIKKLPQLSNNVKRNSVQKSIVIPQKQQHTNIASENTYTVKQQDTLWSISARIAQQTNQSIYSVMQQIQQMNQHAFIRGNKNLIKKGATLDISEIKNINTLSQNSNTEMTVIADKNANSLTTSNEPFSAKHNKQQLALQREEVSSLDKEVAQLEQGLQNKNIKLEILDAKLAKIQQLLQQQNVQKHAAE